MRPKDLGPSRRSARAKGNTESQRDATSAKKRGEPNLRWHGHLARGLPVFSRAKSASDLRILAPGKPIMSSQICPRCDQKGFTWYIDEEDSPLTQWHCALCGYSAQEDESHISDCSSCGTANFRSLLTDPNGAYHYCFDCHTRSAS